MLTCVPLKTFPVAVVALLACDFDAAETSDVMATPAHPIQAVVRCLNSIEIDLDVVGQPLQLRIRYPQAQVRITGKKAGGENASEVFDQVYSNCPFDIVQGTPLTSLAERFDAALPGHPLAAAVEVEGTLHLRTVDKYMYSVTTRDLDREVAVKALLEILASGHPLAEGYYPAIRMRQEIHGAWRDSRRFCYGTFMYYVAPTDTVHVEFAAFPLRVTYYPDHVELTETFSDEAETLQAVFKEGFNGLPDAMKGLDGLVLRPSQPYRLVFSYREFVFINADIDVTLARKSRPPSHLPVADVPGGVDPFPSLASGDRPTFVPPGTPTFQDMTRRSTLLDKALRLDGDTYPPTDEAFPEWAIEAHYRYFPHRRPR